MQRKEEEALPILREALDIFRTHGNDVGAAQCLERIGEVRRRRFDEEEALSTLDEAVEIASRSGDRLGVARALIITGVTHWDQSDPARGAEALSEACTIARKIGWEPGLCGALWNMGGIKMDEGAHAEAEELFQESISVARRSNTRWRLAQGLESLGECFQVQGRLDEAATLLGEACILHRETSQHRDSLRVASTLIDLKSSQGDWGSTLFWCDHSISMNRLQNDPWRVASSLEKKGEILLKAERYDEAALHFEATMIVRIENDDFFGWVYESLSAIPKTAMKWERRLPLLCDIKKLRRRLPQLVTASLKLPILSSPGEL